MARYDYGYGSGYGYGGRPRPAAGTGAARTAASRGAPYDRGRAGSPPLRGRIPRRLPGRLGRGADLRTPSRSPCAATTGGWASTSSGAAVSRPRYEEAYRRFESRPHPHYTPVGGMYPAMGGRLRLRPGPRPAP